MALTARILGWFPARIEFGLYSGPANLDAHKMKKVFAVILTPHIARSSVRIALFVGTLLNLINQIGPLLNGSDLSWVHVFLNYLVPYCVASYSAAKNEVTKSIEKSNVRRCGSHDGTVKIALATCGFL